MQFDDTLFSSERILIKSKNKKKKKIIKVCLIFLGVVPLRYKKKKKSVNKKKKRHVGYLQPLEKKKIDTYVSDSRI